MRTFLIGVFLVGIMGLFLFLRQPTPIILKPEPSITPTVSLAPSSPAKSLDVDNNGRIYRVAWFEVDNPSAVSLIPNFAKNHTARSFIESKECTEVVNGGFYTKDNQPTGLFTSEGKTLHGANRNTLLNGFFLIDKDNRTTIDASTPETPLRIGLQTGPILIRDGKTMNLAIHDDEFARRVGLGITEKGTIVFLAVYDPKNPWNGPKLADAPDVLSKITTHLPLRDVINLDGGSASAFIRSDLSLEELTSVGSFFCIK